MNEIVIIILFVLVGIIAGTGSGLLGIGGGIIYIPSLYFLLPKIGVGQDEIVFVAIATSLFTALFSSGGAFLNHLKVKNVDFKKALLFASGSIIMAFFLPKVIIKLNHIYPKIILLVLMILVLIRFLFDRKKEMKSILLLKDYYLIFFGFLTGALSASSGIGGGVVAVPALALFFGLPFKRAIGTSTLVVFLTLLTSSFSYWLLGSSMHSSGPLGLINLSAAIPMAVGAGLGSVFGTKIAHKYSEKTVKTVFLIFLLVSIAKIISSF